MRACVCVCVCVMMFLLLLFYEFVWLLFLLFLSRFCVCVVVVFGWGGLGCGGGGFSGGKHGALVEPIDAVILRCRPVESGCLVWQKPDTGETVRPQSERRENSSGAD